MIKPTTLYYYEYKRLCKHKITLACNLTVVANEPGGIRYRCRTHDHDVYGYGKQKEAKDFEIRETKSRIYDEKEWLKKLEGVNDDSRIV